VNSASDTTGVQANLVSAGDPTLGLVFETAEFGSDAFVSVRRLGGGGDFFETFDEPGGNAVTRDEGADVAGLINGNTALGDGLELRVNNPSLNISLTLDTDAAQSTAAAYSFDITGGGADFQIGPQVNSLQQVGFGIQSFAASNLGSSRLGFLNTIVTGGDNSLVAGRAREAGNIIDESTTQVSSLRGRLGAFERNTLQTAVRSTSIARENLTAAESQIRDTDFAAETAALTRAQVLQQAGTQTLSLANNNAQNVLSLLQ